MTRIAIIIAVTLALLSTPPPPTPVCTSDADCSAVGVVTCPPCPDYTERLR